MLLSRSYFKCALSLRYGKLILFLQFVLLVVMVFIFFKTIPWLLAHDISQIANYDRPSPLPPAWAESFSVNHGDFIYYPDSRASNPGKMWLYIGVNLSAHVLVMWSTVWVRKKGGAAILGKTS